VLPIGEYFSNARSWREQDEAKANRCLALKEELVSLKEQTRAQERRWLHQEVSYKETLKEAQKAKDFANERLHEAGQSYTELQKSLYTLGFSATATCHL